MSSVKPSPFKTWFDGQEERGLVDIKFSITANTNTSVRSLMDELLAIEAAIKSDLVDSLPVATTMLPQHLQDSFSTITF